MEEHHAKDIESYYNSIAVHQHHNYYEGRADADLTSWVEYFAKLLAKVFTQAKDETIKYAKVGAPAIPDELRNLDHREKIVLSLFSKKDIVTTQDIAAAIGLSGRMVRILLKKWVSAGWLKIAGTSNKTRSYSLSAKYRKYIGNHPA